jgi:menaquinone-dependent protoporphyrinogen oxidase
MSQWHEPARTWVATHAQQLEEMPVAFYTVNLTMASEPERAEEVRAWTDPLIESTGVRPVDVGLFAGWYEPKEFPFLERTILKAMKAPQGDFRDWAAIDSWAEDVSTKMGV